MKLGLRGRMIGASVLLAVVVGTVLAGLAIALSDQRDAARLARHSEEVISTANGLEKLVIDIQTGQRGFAITGETHYLEPLEAGSAALPEESAKLVALVADNPAQESRARAIADDAQAFLEEWSERVVEAARVDPAEARELIVTGEGKRQVDAIRAQFDAFVSAERRLLLERDAHAEKAAHRALVLSVGGSAGAVLLILLFGAYLVRVIIGPVRRVGAGAARVAAGDLSSRVPAGGSGETAELGHAFNAMATSLEEARDELESQNSELELQTTELERQQVEVEAANDELEAQQAELERALGALAQEKERVEAFHEFGERLAAENELETLGGLLLEQLADFAKAEVGALYAIEEESGNLSLLASRGLDRTLVPTVVTENEGLAGRALSEGQVLLAEYGETGLRLPVFGVDVAVHHEVHIPFVQGGRTLGVLTLARATDRGFSSEELEALDHFATQAAVALSNALALRAALREVGINRAVLDATTETIAMTGLDGRVVFANRATQATMKVLGVDGEGTFAEMAAQIRDRTTDPDAYWTSVEKIAANPEVELLDEYELLSGPTIQRYTAPVRDPAGTLIGRLWVLRDISANRDAERLKSELVSTVSHELRTPLAGILGFAELLVTRDVDAETRERYLETIHGEARRLTELINDFLDLQRIEAGRFELKREPFELGALLRNEAQVFVGQSQSHAIKIALPDDPLPVLGERERIAQVVANLLSNAIKYSPDGGDVHVSARANNGAVRVSVTDTGIGIPAVQQPKVFEKFFRVDSSDTRRIGGTGLGLALCREIVNAHGGRIGFTSVESQGSEFWFELPAARRNGSGSRVLVVEDEPSGAALLAEMLSVDGYTVELAASGEDGLRRALADPPVLVCLDIELAGALDGWQVLARLKDDSRTASVPVVVCTGGNGRDKAAVLGAADFLTKPFSTAVLRETLARVLGEGGNRVLVVDDEESVRRLIVETLAGDGIELREAADGAEALEQIARSRPDAVVLDLAMPNVDGFEVLKRLQQDSATRTIPVIVLTARRLSAGERAALSERAVALLEKSSYSAGELRRLLRNALGGD